LTLRNLKLRRAPKANQIVSATVIKRVGKSGKATAIYTISNSRFKTLTRKVLATATSTALLAKHLSLKFTVNIVTKAIVNQAIRAKVTFNILTNALVKNININKVNSWTSSNDQNLEPTEYTESNDSLDPTDYAESTNELGEAVIPDPNYGN